MNERKESTFPIENLQENVDYLYCPVCEKHIPCIRTETGYWEVSQ